MAMYRYVKTYPKPRLSRPAAVSYMFMTAGMGIILWTVWPIVSFFIFSQAIRASTVSPVDAEQSMPASISVLVPQNQEPALADANAWFPSKPQLKVVAPVNSYEISIPALTIEKATVIIAGDDLKKSLIHYGGTALPGEYGNTVIFGHSTLPQLFKGTRDYQAIFSTLPTIDVEDEILVTIDGVKYRYVIYDKVVTEPNDLSPLEQRFEDSYMTLVTCVPPGTLLYRLNVKARLVRI